MLIKRGVTRGFDEGRPDQLGLISTCRPQQPTSHHFYSSGPTAPPLASQVPLLRLPPLLLIPPPLLQPSLFRFLLLLLRMLLLLLPRLLAFLLLLLLATILPDRHRATALVLPLPSNLQLQLQQRLTSSYFCSL